MDETLTLSRHKLQTFLICQRRFQLRYLERLPWPESPLSPAFEAAVEHGQRFHRLLEQHFLGLEVEPDAMEETELHRWWTLFEQSQLQIPHGRVLAELSLTVPAGRHLLTGRFDLLVTGEDEASGEPFAHVFDWKTGQPRAEDELRQDWQTRLYLAMLAEGGRALWPDGSAAAPDHIAITYWYAADPAAPCTIRYSQAWHKQNWAEIEALVAQIDGQLAAGDWPLTDDWSHCRHCAYQAYCNRQEAGQAEQRIDDDGELDTEAEEWLEPELP
ncbi:MAG TPA: PD-(D/E)XK nuclease family protein [Anaerolineae bacterium]